MNILEVFNYKLICKSSILWSQNLNLKYLWNKSALIKIKMCNKIYIYIFKLLLKKPIRNLVLKFQAFEHKENVFINTYWKKNQKFLMPINNTKSVKIFFKL